MRTQFLRTTELSEQTPPTHNSVNNSKQANRRLAWEKTTNLRKMGLQDKTVVDDQGSPLELLISKHPDRSSLVASIPVWSQYDSLGPRPTSRMSKKLVSNICCMIKVLKPHHTVWMLQSLKLSENVSQSFEPCSRHAHGLLRPAMLP